MTAGLRDQLLSESGHLQAGEQPASRHVVGCAHGHHGAIRADLDVGTGPLHAVQSQRDDPTDPKG